jgi:hypothetical protein
MSMLKALALTALALPLSAQAWDLRVEVPYPKGQSLPGTLLGGTVALAQKSLDTGHGFILSASHRIVRVGPVLKLEWGAEYAQWQADGKVQQDTAVLSSRTRQTGLGLGVNAQFWVPFTGLAAELGLLERIQSYKFEVDTASRKKTLSRPWLRAGLRYNLPLPVVNPYLAASYQQPITKDKPVQLASAADLGAYLGAQGSGQEFQRLWTFGVGITF